MQPEKKVTLVNASKILDCSDLVRIFNEIISSIKKTQVVENIMALSNSKCVNIIDVGLEPNDTDSMFGIKCMVVIGDIEYIEKTKSLLSSKQIACSDFGVLTKRKLVWKPYIPNVYYFLDTTPKSTEFTYILCKTCDVISNFTIEHMDPNKVYVSVEDDKLRYCKVSIVIGNCTIHYPKCHSGKTYAVGLNMLHEQSKYNHIKLNVESVGESLDINDIKITIGEIFLNSETRRDMHAEELLLSIY